MANESVTPLVEENELLQLIASPDANHEKLLELYNKGDDELKKKIRPYLDAHLAW